MTSGSTWTGARIVSPGGPATAPAAVAPAATAATGTTRPRVPSEAGSFASSGSPVSSASSLSTTAAGSGAAATTLAATTGTAVAGRGSSSSAPAVADSYSATDAKTASPAEAARARVAGSPVTIDSRLSWVSASRDRSRKLIRDVATREPYGKHDRDPRRIGGADARRRGRDLVVDLEVDDPAGHGQTFIARSTRRSATSSASSDVWSSIAW